MPIPESMTESQRETAAKIGTLLDRVMRLERALKDLAEVGGEIVDAHDDGDIECGTEKARDAIDMSIDEMRDAVAAAGLLLAK